MVQRWVSETSTAMKKRDFGIFFVSKNESNDSLKSLIFHSKIMHSLTSVNVLGAWHA